MTRKTLYIVTALATLMTIFPAGAARERQNIYLFDCTNSMKRSGIWDKAKDALRKTVGSQASDPDADFILIPFGNTPYKTVRFSGSDVASHDWQKTFKAFDGHMSQATSTHISDVLRAGFGSSDSNKDTDIFLLTDGDPNSGDSPERVARKISRWCGNHRNARLFYVALKGASINPEIKQAIDQCDDAWLIDCTDGRIAVPMPVGTEVYASLLDLGRVSELSYSDPSTVRMHVESADPYFNVAIEGGASRGGIVPLKFSLRDSKTPEEVYPALAQAGGPDGIYQFMIRVVADDGHSIIANPDVRACISIERLARLTLLGGTAEEIKIEPGAKWHDAFLWSKASAPGTVSIDLNAEFTDIDPAKEEPAVAFMLESTDSVGGKAASDFTVTYNGITVAPGDPILVTPGGDHLLTIIFDTDARTGKRYFRLVPEAARNVGIINGVPAGHLEELPMRTSYKESWNPLKTALFWTAVIILGALLLWFAVLRRMLYPTIRTGSITMTGPDSYFRQKKIRGARRVVLTARSRKQSALSRLFTGRVEYVQAPHFTPELYIVPASRKRIRFERTRGWTIFPSATLSSHSEAEVTGGDAGNKFKVTAN